MHSLKNLNISFKTDNNLGKLIKNNNIRIERTYRNFKTRKSEHSTGAGGGCCKHFYVQSETLYILIFFLV